MGKKTVIEQNIRKHTKELEDSISLITPGLIEAFVRVYGEKHRENIIYIINRLEYIFFISEKFISVIKNNYGIRKSHQRIMTRYLKYLEQVSYKFNCVAIEDEQKYIIKKFLPRFPYIPEDYEYFADAIEEDVPCCMAKARKDEETLEPDFVILLPIFTIDLKIIIHEINHALGANPLCIVNDNYMLVDFLFKKEIPEELENDFIAELVLKEYLKMGYTIPKPLKRIPIGNAYKEKDYIIKYLFDCLDFLLIEARITRNYNLFYQFIGIDNFEYLSDLIETLYNNFTEEKFYELLDLINQLVERIANAKVETKEEHLARIESFGIKLKRIRKD